MKAFLIADNQPETRDRVRGYLESRGYDVVGTNDHGRGTSLELSSDLALLDLDTLTNGHTPYVPIITVTGFAKHADARNGMSDDFVDFRALRDKVSALLREKSGATN